MADITVVQNYLAEENSQAFLVEYLTLQEAGYNLPIPSALELDGVIEGWNQILEQSFNASPSAGFVEEVSTIWLNAVKKQGSKITDSFATELINILTGRAPAKAAAKAPQQQPAAPQGKKAAPALQKKNAPVQESEEEETGETPVYRTSTNHEVVSHISADYRSAQSVRKSSVLSKDELYNRCTTALKQNNDLEFLLYYVSNIKHGEIPEVPLELSHEPIMANWERIITNRFHYYNLPEFYEKLTDLWVNVVHIAGPIISNEAYYKVLEKLEVLFAKKESSKPAPVSLVKKQPQKKKTIGSVLLKIFHLFF